MNDRSRPNKNPADSLFRPSYGRSALPLIAILLLTICPGTIMAGSGNLDTTRVRETRKIKLSFGEVLTEIPGEILKLPFRVIEIASKALTNNPVSDNVGGSYRWVNKFKQWVPVAGYSTNAGLKFGLGFRQTSGLGPDGKIRFKWYYSTNNYQMYDFRYRVMDLFSPRVGLDVNIFYRARTRERFYGIGMDADPDHEARIYNERTAVHGTIPIHFSKQIKVSVSGGYQVSNIYDGQGTKGPTSLDIIKTDPIYRIRNGQLNSSRFATLGGAFTIDLRHVPGKPSHGAWFSTDYTYFSGKDRSDGLNYSRYNFELRYFQSLPNRHMLAFRVNMRRLTDNGTNDRAAPVDLIQSLGGPKTLRSYISGRFLDNDMALASVEYRYPVHELFDAFVFYEQGRVFDNITQRKVLNGWRYSSGMGFRFGTFEAVKLMTQFAFSADGARFYIEMGADW